MDHRYSSEFRNFVLKRSVWRIKHVCNTRHKHTCTKPSQGTCIDALCCTCSAAPANYPAQLIEKMAGSSAIADVDVLVDSMSDDEAAKYGALRDEFLRAETTKYRSIERARKAAADLKTSQGGECVYFVLGDGRLKIGTSANVEKRLTALQTSSAVRLTLILTLPGGTEIETLLHRRFSHIREGGEWFIYTDELKHFIEGAAFFKTHHL